MPKRAAAVKKTNNTFASEGMRTQFERHCEKFDAAARRAEQLGVGALFHNLFCSNIDDRRPIALFHSTQRTFRLVNEQRTSSSTLKGITRTLRRLFWPDYDYYKIPRRTTRGQSAAGGISLGSRVHSELDEITRKRSIECDRASYTSAWRSASAYTRDLIHTMEQKWGWEILITEVPVLMHETGMASAIDVVCYSHHSARLVLVELKTGYDDVMLIGSGGRMRCSLGVDDSPLNQAFVQIGVVAHALAAEAAVPISRFDCFVVQVNQRSIVPYQVPSTLLTETVPLAYQRLIQRHLRRRRQGRRRK